MPGDEATLLIQISNTGGLPVQLTRIATSVSWMLLVSKPTRRSPSPPEEALRQFRPVEIMRSVFVFSALKVM